MLYLNRVITGLTLLVVLTACEREAPELSQADKEAVKAHIEKYRQAVLAADWDAWGRTLAADVFASPPNVAPMTGREAAVAWVKTFPKITGLTVNVDEVTGRGDLAYARGTYGLSLTLPDGSPMTERGSFLEVHRRQADGTWPYTHLMYHSTEPLPAAPPAGKK